MKILIASIVISLMIVSSCSHGGRSGGVNSSVKADDFREINVTAYQWKFDPEVIKVKNGEKVRLLVKSIDVRHGFAIAEYGLDVKIDPGQVVPVEFVADKSGTFSAYCSVPCGSGHRSMKASLIVE